jgi:hypothetical protein
MPVDIFFATGATETSFWAVNDSINFGYLSAQYGSTFKTMDQTFAPIRLRVGNKVYGQKHIEIKHKALLLTNNISAAELVYLKLRQSGVIYSTEDVRKTKISLRVNPSALMILELRKEGAEIFWSVVSIYTHPKRLDGTELGRYKFRPNANPEPNQTQKRI